MKLYLHIGWPRSGSTTIQSVLHKNRAKLLEHGVLYPKTGAQDVGHHRWAAPAVPEPIDWIKPADKDVLLSQLRDEITSSEMPISSVIMSSEAFIYCQDFTFFEDYFEGFELEIIAVLREQLSLINSAYYRQLSTNATKLSPAHYADSFMSKPDYFYQQKLSPLVNNANLTPTLHTLSFHSFNDGFWSKFLELLGIPDLPFVAHGNERKNASLSGKAIKILQSWPSDTRLIGPKYEQFREQLLELFGPATPGDTLLPDDTCNKVIETYADDRQWVLEQFGIVLPTPTLNLDSSELSLAETFNVIHKLV